MKNLQQRQYREGIASTNPKQEYYCDLINHNDEPHL